MNNKPKEIIEIDNVHPVIASKRDNQIFISSSITSGLFEMSEPLEAGYVYNIGYDQVKLELKKDNNDTSVVNNLSDFDKLVYDAICSIDVMMRQKLNKLRVRRMEQMESEGCSKEAIAAMIASPEYTLPVFSTRQVYKLISGELAYGTHPTIEALANIEESIKKLSSLKIDISYESPDDKDSRDSSAAYLLQLTEQKKNISQIDEDGNIIKERVKYYTIDRVPILYQYAIFKESLSVLPSALIQTKSVRNTKSLLSVKGYLINRILDVGFLNEHSVLINFNPIYDLVEAADAKRKTRARESVFKLLDDWIESGFIEKWEICETTSGKRKTPVAIMVHLENNYSYSKVIENYEKMLGKRDE